MTEFPSADAPAPADTGPRRGLLFWAGLLCVAGIGTLYVLLPSENFTDAKDSLQYAYRIGNGDPMFHPNHLLYEPAVWVFWRLVQLVGVPLEPLAVMQWFSILCALPFLVFTYLLAWRPWRNVAAAVLTTGAVGFSFGVWVYAVAPDGYLPPLSLALLTLILLDPQSWRARHESLPHGLLLGAALATAAAVLLHQMYVVFALICGFVLLFRPEFGPLRDRFRAFEIYGGLSGGLVLLVYLVVHRFVAADMAFLDWARGYARGGIYYGDPPSLLSPVKGAIGALSTMLTMNGLLAFDFLADRLMRTFAAKSLYEEHFIAQTAISPWLKLPILMAMLGASLLWLAMAATAVQAHWRLARLPEYADRILLLAALLYAGLVIVWEPTNREFWIQTYVFATIWCGRQICGLTQGRGLILAGLAACLFIVNFFAALLPLSDARSDYWRVYNEEVLMRRGTVKLVVTDCSWLCMWSLRYYSAAEVVSPARLDPEVLQAKIAAAAGEVLVSSLAYAPHRLASDYNAATIHPEWREVFRAAYPPPGPLPEDDTRQVFFGIANGRVVPLD
jgi:hypothetical protein